jgi:hypothetical protein
MRIKLLILFAVFIFSTGCTTYQSIKYNHVPFKEVPKGKLDFVNFQLGGYFSFNVGNHTFSTFLKEPIILLKPLAQSFPLDVAEKIFFKEESQEMRRFFVNDFDEEKNDFKLNEISLKYLNKHHNSDYFLILQGDFDRVDVVDRGFFSSPSYNVSMKLISVIYNRNGEKVYSNTYYKKRENLEFIEIKTTKIYYEILSDLVSENSRDIAEKASRFIDPKINVPLGQDLKSLFVVIKKQLDKSINR